MANQPETKVTVKIVHHTCGHTSRLELDASTRGCDKEAAKQKCLECEPTIRVERLCGCIEDVPRNLLLPRLAEWSAMQLCRECQ